MPNGDTPAFPQPFAREPGANPALEGLTKREYVATQLLAGLRDSSMISNTGTLGGRRPTEWAVWIADALLEALDTKENPQ